MRIRSSMLALGLCLGALAATPAFAAGAQSAGATAHKTPTAQQQKMAACGHQSKGMKGDAHKKFMRDCLHGKTVAATPAKAAQPSKMKTCNADAKARALKGAARKSFMSTCLKG
ncbi:MAG: phosphate starvation-inducible protein PsiF [Rhodanobacteraceae bacterium]|nr:MAG: phosphate starvation-inducible protein PsiF [Rhodanobacteraceae bacterium]